MAPAKTAKQKPKTAKLPPAPPPSSDSSTKPKSKRPTQTEGDRPTGKSQPATAPLRPHIPYPAELLARVPAAGPLNGEHLILLAIANSIELQHRRAEITGAKASKEAARELPNPELRLSYASQDDDQLRLPYTETIRRSLSPFPSVAYREIERMISPGREFDSYTINEYDVFNDGVNPVSRTLAGTTYEQRASTQTSDGGEQTGLMLRFQLPNPWERKARIQRAAAEVLLAEGEYLAAEDKLVRQVRELYETLSGHDSELSVHEKRMANYRAMRREMEGGPDPSFLFEAARARNKMTGIQIDMNKVHRSADGVRGRLAALCGLADSSRIRSSGIVTRRIVDSSVLDEDYLVEIAMLHRSDAVEITARRDIAVARLAEAKAQGKLFATFFDVGWNRSDDDGRTGNDDEVFARLGISIPVFDFLRINKASKAYAAYAAEMDQVLQSQRSYVRNQVRNAIRGMKLAAANGRQADGDVSEARREAKAIEASLNAIPIEMKDIVKGTGNIRRYAFDNEDMVLETHLGRVEAWSDYNKALRALEDAIGTRIEKALAR